MPITSATGPRKTSLQPKEQEALRAPDIGSAAPSFEPPSPRPASVGPSPVTLNGSARGSHVVEAIVEYERAAFRRAPDAILKKLEKLTQGPFVFFRGTADLFNRDLAGVDAKQPKVLVNGDVHPENLGVLRAPDGSRFYGLDDHDEAHLAPFGWDLRRGACALVLAGRAVGMTDAECGAAVGAFTDAYFDALKKGPRGEGAPRFSSGEVPGVLAEVMDEAARRKRAKVLAKDVDLDAERFLESDELVSRRALIPELENALVGYRRRLEDPPKKKHLAIRDVAEKRGSGTGSIGLARFYVLLRGEKKNAKDDVLLELKEVRPSVLTRHVTLSQNERNVPGALKQAIEDLWSKGDRYAGAAVLGGRTYRVRERLPQHTRVEVAKLDARGLKKYAAVMGALVADQHMTPGFGSKRPEKAILRSVDRGRFEREMNEFAFRAAARVEADHAAFAQLHAAGRVGPKSFA